MSKKGGIQYMIQEVDGDLEGPKGLTDAQAEEAWRFHKSIPGYQQTRLIKLGGKGEKLHVKSIYVKDESTRFGLKAFKGLGGSYAMFRVLCERLGINPEQATYTTFLKPKVKEAVSKLTFVTATDGNHGKGVSWAAGLFGCSAFVFMPRGSSKERAQAIRQAGPAAVEITDKNYDETVAYANILSNKNGWILIQDTAWEGYEQIPFWIIQGYLTMAKEAVSDLDASGIVPTHVFLQAGVGAMAGGVCGFLMNHYEGRRPRVCVVEADKAACVYLSASFGDGKVHSVEGDPVTIMAGLNCGTPCKTTWPVLRDFSSAYFAVPDYVVAVGMRMYADPLDGDQAIISGESGAVTFGTLLQLLEDAKLQPVREHLGINSQSVIFLINTEGDTDPVSYQSIIKGDAFKEAEP